MTLHTNETQYWVQNFKDKILFEHMFFLNPEMFFSLKFLIKELQQETWRPATHMVTFCDNGFAGKMANWLGIWF